jgi:branched-chain amino acid transport system permease protein
MSAWSEGLASPHRYLAARTRWQPIEIVFWIATLLPYVLVPSYLTLASQIAITALFALSLDLILGYAGIVSLGHAAFFGWGPTAQGFSPSMVGASPFRASWLLRRWQAWSAMR